MASSSIHKSIFKYDVFLSFRVGWDLRTTADRHEVEFINLDSGTEATKCIHLRLSSDINLEAITEGRTSNDQEAISRKRN
ncbi:hypothetical protein L6452_28438 [Arctium lappa]|uniref:Uncharacterized protein n=1 Tax=Arctium lappa TaxID=4217 RepID=A0ACB8ZXJ5_ARCLA|nr:hypothetical protein L6452_28438 [Arctium lappa]